MNLFALSTTQQAWKILKLGGFVSFMDHHLWGYWCPWWKIYSSRIRIVGWFETRKKSICWQCLPFSYFFIQSGINWLMLSLGQCKLATLVAQKLLGPLLFGSKKEYKTTTREIQLLSFEGSCQYENCHINLILPKVMSSQSKYKLKFFKLEKSEG